MTSAFIDAHPGAPPAEELWIQIDGSAIPVGQMTLEHLQNTLRMLIRSKNKRALARKVAKVLEMMPSDWDDGFNEEVL